MADPKARHEMWNEGLGQPATVMSTFSTHSG
jgi:hypothetical protein